MIPQCDYGFDRRPQDFIAVRMQNADRCWIQMVQRRDVYGWDKAYFDPAAASRSIYAGTCITRKIHSGITALWPYEDVRCMYVSRLVSLLRCRMHDACSKYDPDSLPMRPSEMAIGCLGCTPSQLAERFENLFDHRMSWENMGAKGWAIDHIRPLSWFDLKHAEAIKEVCHHSNLRPCMAAENTSKSDRLILGLTV